MTSRDPVAATAIVEQHAAPARAVKHAIRIDPGGNRARASVDQITFAWFKTVTVGNVDIVAHADISGVQRQQSGQRLRQHSVVAAKTRQARHHGAGLADGQHGTAQPGERGVHGCAARIAAHLQGRQAFHGAVGHDDAVNGGQGPARLRAARVDAQA
jgi:hypothetical protein